MKRFMALFLALSLLAFAGCGKKNKDQDSNQDGNQDYSSSDTSTEEKSTTETNNSTNKEDSVQVGTPDENHKASKIVNILQSHNFSLTAEINGNSFKMSSRGNTVGKTSVLPGGAEKAVVIKNGTTYMIDHESKLVITSSVSVSSSASGVVGGDFNLDNISFISSGKGNFNGSNLDYDEYKTDGGNLKFFMNGENLAGISSVEDGNEILYVVSKLEPTPDDSLFDIPQTYQVFDMAAQGG